MGGAQLEVRLLGPLEVSTGDRPLAVGGPKPRALLATLALDVGRVVSVDRIVESLWPVEPPETAAHAVQVYVSQLRKALGNDVIATRPPGYVLELDPESVDAQRFEHLAGDGREALAAGDPATASTVLREALGLWSGPALADFTYEPFAQAEIARLDELREVALEERVEADLALGRHAEVVAELEALVEAQPLRERPRGQLMLALYRSGRQADALAVYRDARETLVEELGIDPGPELRELEAAILRQDESLLPPADEAAAPAMQFRRLVTILVVDVVESLALSAALDAEAVGRVLSEYFDAVSAAVQRHGGTVEKYAGDAVMAVFGIPISHEDDALRAARAALDVRAAVSTLDQRLVQAHGVGLEARIGIEAGEVVTTPTELRQRLVTGEAVGIAAKLEHSAAPNEIVVGEVAARLIDHAARLEGLGELSIKGKREPVRPFRLVEITEAAPAFEQRLDAKLVGRKRELAALRKSLKQAVEDHAARVALVVGAPGVGKSRLAVELTRRAKGVTALWGRCLPYGDGVTYWPVREVIERATETDQGAAVLAALEAETPPAAPEIALLFRRFCEALAREQPLVVVFDDVHWAEPTFLELVEQIADRGEGPILVVCVAREELLEERPELLGEHESAQRIQLDELSPEDTDALLEALGGGILETDARRRIVETAQGNPLFLEQLLALGLEGGLAERELPLTVQALLAARLDRLGPGERAVLERGSIVLRSFTHDDVVALLEPEAAPTVEAHLRTLVERGFLRPSQDAFRFRHIVVQDAVYRAAPKRLRAELHERFADRLDRTAQELVELDEFVGYHLERAYLLRTELGESDRRTAGLAEDGGRRLGAAGIRAYQRSDVPAAVHVLARATRLVPPDDPLNRELRCNLGTALNAAGDAEGAISLLANLVADSHSAGDERMAAWSGLELEFIQLRRESRTAETLLAAAENAIPIFERAGDHRALGRAWLFIGWLQGGHWANHAAWVDGAERALEHYRAAGWPTSSCLAELAAAIYWGPTPTGDAVTRYRELLDDTSTNVVGAAFVRTMLGGVLAQLGEVEDARTEVQSARATFEELGQRWAALSYCGTVAGEIELLVGDGIAAETILRGVCEGLRDAGDFSQLASRSSDLAEALVLQDRLEEAEEQTEIARRHAADDDIEAQMMWRPVQATILARRGNFVAAEALAREGTELADRTDDLNRRAEAYRDLGTVGRSAGREAASSFRAAVDLFELKGNVVGAARVRALADEPVLA